MKGQYRVADITETEALAKLATDSFYHYPLFQITRDEFKKEKDYYNFLYTLELSFIKTFIKYHDIIVEEYDNKIISFAMIEEIGKVNLNLVKYIRDGGLVILKYASPVTVLKFMDMLDETRTACDAIKNPNHWYLANIAVDIKYQGIGHGSNIIKEFLIPYVRDKGGKIFTLTTNTEANSIFYKKNGFINFDFRKVNFDKKSIGNWSFKMSI